MRLCHAQKWGNSGQETVQKRQKLLMKRLHKQNFLPVLSYGAYDLISWDKTSIIFKYNFDIKHAKQTNAKKKIVIAQ